MAENSRRRKWTTRHVWLYRLFLAALLSSGHLFSACRAELVASAATAPIDPVLQRIWQSATASDAAYQKLIELCDDIGHRLSGSPQLDLAAAWAVKALRQDGIATARLEPVMVPKWLRGKESLQLVAPRAMPLVMLGLGGSTATPVGGLKAEVLVVRDLAELKTRAAAAKGKIVLFNQAMPAWTPQHGSGYGDTVQQRVHGAQWAFEHGAVAALVRSVTAQSLSTPHTGGTRHQGRGTPVPVAAISVEHAELLARFAARGIKTEVLLQMEAHEEEPAASHNVVAELIGSEHPGDIVVIGGHLDSWDVGQGAHDDGAGVVAAMQALATLQRLGLQPKRTIRVVLFTNEENGLAGGKAYFEAHKAERHVALLEADSGGFAPVGLGVHGKDDAGTAALAAWAGPWLQALAAIVQLQVVPGEGGADISPWLQLGVPNFGLVVQGEKYFDYHHTAADTVDKVDAKELARCAATMAVVAWQLAERPPD